MLNTQPPLAPGASITLPDSAAQGSPPPPARWPRWSGSTRRPRVSNSSRRSQVQSCSAAFLWPSTRSVTNAVWPAAPSWLSSWVASRQSNQGASASAGTGTKLVRTDCRSTRTEPINHSSRPTTRNGRAREPWLCNRTCTRLIALAASTDQRTWASMSPRRWRMVVPLVACSMR